MNHFEELGLSRSATGPEIRRAYRILARLLHPDRQQDEAHRQLVECQMKRLNETVHIFLDPAERQEYEAEIDSAEKRPERPAIIFVQRREEPPEGWRRFLSWPGGWYFVAGFFVSSIVWFSVGPDRISTARPASALSSTSLTADELQGREISDAASRIDELQQRLSLLERRRDHGGNGNAPEQALPTFGPTFGGSWRYDAPLVDGTSATQVRQILMRIDELTAGRIQGRYTSSAQGFDGAPASVFVFEFAGTITGRQGAFPWTATGGATGEIQLRLLGRNVLDARWWPDGVGESSIGTSGGAVFHRDLIP